MGIFRNTPQVVEVAQDVEAVIIAVAIKEEEFLIIHQSTEQTIPITLT